MRSNLPPKLSTVSTGVRLSRRAHAVACVLLLALFSISAPSQTPPAGRQIHVLAASDLQSVLPALADAYQHATGIQIVPTYGSSATLATQILNGDPADLFLAADFSYPEKIIAASLADSTSPIPYASGTLVLFARKDSPLQPLTQNTLFNPNLQSIAIADPLHAPYGVAAQQALFHMRLTDKLKSHLVVAENVAQAAQFVESGNAQLGFISLTLASSPHMQQVGTFLRIQPSAYPPINQSAVVMKNSAHRAEAHAFLDWLRSPMIQEKLPSLGLDPIH
jgi:molybdate transport system substrate-binding protein